MTVKKLCAFICVFFILISSSCVLAEDEKLYEVYEIQEDFEYDDVSVGHALKSSVVQIILKYSATINYRPVIFDSDYFEDKFNDLYDDYSSQYKKKELKQQDVIDEIMARVITELQNDIEENAEDYIDYDSPEEVHTEGEYVGSGVVISEDGYIATNSHVATLSDEGKADLYILGLQQDVYDDLVDIFSEAEEMGITMTDEQIYMVYEALLIDAANSAEIVDEDTSLHVYFPSASGDTSVSDSISYKARNVAEGTQDGLDGLTQDTAILKINAKNLVALKLSDSYPQLNSKVISAGYPSASDSSFLYYGSDEAVLSVTVTDGKVSRLVPITDSDYQAIQITSTISGGNSGGPSVDTNLNIEGLNTYANSQDIRYAYMIPAEYVNELASEFDIGQDETSKTFLLGLQMLQQGYGKTALECFERVKELQPDTPYIENLIDIAEEAPDVECPDKTVKSTNEQNDNAESGAGKEKESDISVFDKIDYTVVLIAVLAVALIAVLTTIFVTLANKKKHKRMAAAIERERSASAYGYDTSVSYNILTENTAPTTTENITSEPVYSDYNERPVSVNTESGGFAHSYVDDETVAFRPNSPEEIKPKLKFSKNIKRDE